MSVAKIDAENAVIYAKSWGKCSELTAFIAATHAVTTGIATMLVAHAARAGWRCCKTGFCAPNCDGAATEPLLLEFFMVGSRLKIRVSLVRFRLRPPFLKHLRDPSRGQHPTTTGKSASHLDEAWTKKRSLFRCRRGVF